MNYTKEITEAMKTIYMKSPNKDTVLDLARIYGKSTNSIIGKLRKEGVYRREVYKTKMGTKPITKAEMIVDICDSLNTDELPGLEKTPKATLTKLEKLVRNNDTTD